MNNKIPSPCFVLEEKLLRRNLELIKRVKEEAGISIILAFKGFAMWSVFPIVREYLDGATTSSLNEARLCFEEMKSLSHTYMAAYLPDEFDQMMQYSSHLSFNSLSQYEFYRERVENFERKISCGLRVNPEYAEVETDLYNPAAPGSRLGVAAAHVKDGLPKGIEGLHFHSLCESDSFALERTLDAFVKRYEHLLPQVKWVNMGGGHLMTKEGYNVDHLITLLKNFREKYDVDIILEPGSAIAWETGYLYTTILDIVENHGIKTAMLDVSFTAHMPDTLEMPYRPLIRGASEAGQGKYNYRIGGMSCLAGDFMQAYGFEEPLEIGGNIILEDMMHYTMVKTTHFNGVKHPAIAILDVEKRLYVVREFGYEDYKTRLS